MEVVGIKTRATALLLALMVAFTLSFSAAARGQISGGDDPGFPGGEDGNAANATAFEHANPHAYYGLSKQAEKSKGNSYGRFK